MDSRWVMRRGHARRLPSGRIVLVRDTWARCSRPAESQNSGGSKCPYCRTKILSIQMQNGGWGHFESTPGLRRVKHPCFTRGNHLSRKRDDQTIDLFDGAEACVLFNPTKI